MHTAACERRDAAADGTSPSTNGVGWLDRRRGAAVGAAGMSCRPDSCNRTRQPGLYSANEYPDCRKRRMIQVGPIACSAESPSGRRIDRASTSCRCGCCARRAIPTGRSRSRPTRSPARTSSARVHIPFPGLPVLQRILWKETGSPSQEGHGSAVRWRAPSGLAMLWAT